MYSGFPAERRKHRRYIVRGMVSFRADGLIRTGELVNFGCGGMLVRSNYVLPEGSEVSFRVVAYCYPSSFEARAQVVGGRISLMALQFLERPAGVDELLLWLEQEHCPWTGTFSPDEVQILEPQQTNPRIAPQPVSEADLDDALEEIYHRA